MRRARIILSILFCLAAFAARAAHTQVKLILSADVAKPGDTIWAGVDLKMEFGWHTYWKNPGAAGMATSIKWQLPAGVSAGEIQWPLPEKLPPIEVTTYGYENEVMLLVPLTIASNLPPGTIDFDLKANVSWLECKDVCIPQNQDVEAKLIVGNETKNSTNLATIDLWKKKVPLNTYWLNSFNAQVHWLDSTNNDVRRLIINSSAISNTNSDFFPFAYDNFEIQPDLQTRVDSSGAITLIKFVKKFAGDWPKAISGVLIVEKNSSRIGYEINGFPIDDQPPTNFAIQNSVENLSADKFVNLQTNLSAKSLWQYLLYAFIGGLILNIMPCVLPVIALKILGFVSEARNEPRRVRNLGFIYALGVLVSFLALAAVVIGVKAAGHHAGWGMQFGSPIFVVCLTTLVLLVALNLFGVFEITPGGKILNAAGQLASKHGAPGAFFNGVLATILATPCTAPFLSAALAFAFTQNSATILLIFLFVGIGLAAPYVLLSCNPALLKFLPKPGAWMEKFKIAIGFPMLATAVWLFNVAASDYGARVFWLGVFLVAVAFAAWIFGEFVQRGRNGKTIAFAVILIFLAGGYIFALENKLHWREMNSETGATNSLANSSNGIDWQQWSPQAVAQARADGKIVLVDFTATWCVTCNAIIKPALENDSVVAKLKEIGAATFLADYTRTPQNMTDEISKYGAGVPLVLIYPKNSGEPPMVLPQPSPLQLPSGYAKIVLDALDRAAD